MYQFNKIYSIILSTLATSRIPQPLGSIFFLQDEEDEPEPDHPLDSIACGVLEARSFLFLYDTDDDKELHHNEPNIWN